MPLNKPDIQVDVDGIIRCISRKTQQETDAYFEFLDGLRESGITNMFGAASYLQEVFPELTKEEARLVLKAWMQTFKTQHLGREIRKDNEKLP